MARPTPILVLTLLIVCAGAATAYAVHDGRRSPHAARPPASVTPHTAPLRGPRIVFRYTGLDAHYGLVAMVPLSHPGGPRTFTGVACDRVYATAAHVSCLQSHAGSSTAPLDLLELGRGWHTVQTDPLEGIPSRTRLSPDGSLVASTTFVSGHAYRQVGFSTETEVRHFGGSSYGNLEDFTLIDQGHTIRPKDRNVWGVTFARDDDTFFATVGMHQRTYLVKGSLSARTLTIMRQNAACPSLSPDGRRLAYKVDIGHGARPYWSPAVLDLRTGVQTILSGERRSIDDQIEWLDSRTVLYGMPRAHEAGVDDVWSLRTSSKARPHVLIREAWSPAVVR